MSRWQWLASRLLRRIWFRAALFCVLGGVTATAAAFLDPLIPENLPTRIGADAVHSVLSIMASSMLAVATFSLSTMVSAYGAVTSSTTPRATSLLAEDVTAQNALSVFIGAFLFSLVGIILLSTGIYGRGGRSVLMVATILVVCLVVAVLIRWIEHLGAFGRVGATIDSVEDATAKALKDRVAQPFLGGTPSAAESTARPALAVPIHALEIGYIQHIDLAALSRCAEDAGTDIYLDVLPGNFIDPSRPVAWAAQDVAAATRESIRAAMTIGAKRTFDQDPRFGLIVLSEIASRALSPAVNDPGTAIDVIGSMVRLLAVWAEAGLAGEPRVEFPRVYVPGLTSADLFDDVVTPIARDGAAVVEVGIRLLKALRALEQLGDTAFREAARRHASLALDRAEGAMAMEEDLARLRRLLA
jgi:uncharacterized membrane protein